MNNTQKIKWLNIALDREKKVLSSLPLSNEDLHLSLLQAEKIARIEKLILVFYDLDTEFKPPSQESEGSFNSRKCDYIGTPPFADAEWKDDPTMCQWCASTGHPYGDETYGLCECPTLRLASNPASSIQQLPTA